jgi:signal transduction histidine kinase
MTRLQCLEEEFAATLEEAKLKALYTLAAGAGHEINNPLGSIAGRAQLLLRDENDAERRRTLAKINSQAFRAHEMISDMMLFAKPPQPVREPVDLVPLAQQVLDSLRELAGQRNTALACESPPQPIMLYADPAQISVALRAMCLNSIEALGGGGRVEIQLSLVGEGSSRHAEITVHDDGPGISPQQREHIFDPFYSGREAGRGLGFGLSKSWRIVQNHGGRIEVQSAPGHGSTFRICLPAA